MSEKFIELQRCRDEGAVDELREILTAADVPFRVAECTSDALIASTYGAGNEPETIVSVPEAEYGAARAALEIVYGQTELPEDHYLREMSDAELVDVVGREDQWSAFDVVHARRLAEDRGIDPAEIVRERKAELERLQAGKPAPEKLIRAGWRGAITGGIVGLLIAWSICTAKERTAQGEFFTYDTASREKGKLILWTALAVLAVLAVAAAALAIWVSV